ncbi:MAG: 50S ribosomal protein L22 [Candidatus Bathyarchaeia archaeon]
MPNWGYSITGLDPNKTAIASGRDLKISPKAAREICATIRQMRLKDAEAFLADVIEKRRPVPFKHHNKEVPHRRGLQGWYAGRYPVKAARELLKLLKSLEANAGEKDLEIESLKIIHAAAQRGMKIRKVVPRAFGRSSVHARELVHIELAVAKV